jgi:hypothetical protein
MSMKNPVKPIRAEEHERAPRMTAPNLDGPQAPSTRVISIKGRGA